MKEYIVETIALTKQFRHQKAVNAVNMKVEKGAIYGFIGRNGAGKTTTLKMLCGLCTPTSGEIRLFQNSYQEFTYRSIGALIENTGAYPELSAKDNMLLKATGLGLHDPMQVDELLQLVNLTQAGKKPVKTFSLGMKQRLGIALALLGNPELLILDEPINGLDPEGIREIRNTILTLNKEKGITIIISSHILGELHKMATHYGIIKDGELLEQITQEELAATCRNFLALRVSDTQKATFLLEEKLKILDYEVMEDGEIHIYMDVDSEKINIEFMKHNLTIAQMYYQKQDLESYFLQRIGGNTNV